MLVRFIVANFLSFSEETEFNMIAGSYRNHNHHLYRAKSLKILKGSAIYGSNGAGKSNFIQSIQYIKDLVVDGRLEKSINTKKFKLSKSSIDKPTSFEIEFYHRDKIYNYGVDIIGKTIENEWLYISGIDKEDKLIFERKTTKKGKTSINFNDKYLKTGKSRLLVELMESNLLKKNEVLIGKHEEFKITDLNNVFNWISHHLTIIYPKSTYDGLIPFLINSQEFKHFTNSLLSTLKTGVEKLYVENVSFDSFFGIDDKEFKNELIESIDEDNEILIPNGVETVLATKENGEYVIKKIKSLHLDGNNEYISFDLKEESDGTRRLLDFIPAFHGMLQDDTTFVVDEIDRSIHATLLIELIRKIMNSDKTKGQLIFTTHESNLLDFNFFRQDEIWFAEKDNLGSTTLYSLSDFKPRYDLDIRKGYLKGRFGGIPFTTELKKLKWLHSNEKKERV